MIPMIWTMVLLGDCGNDDDDESDDRANIMKEPTTEVSQASCSAEERRCPGRKFVERYLSLFEGGVGQRRREQ